MPDYMLILRDLPDEQAGTPPEAMQRNIQKYIDWAGGSLEVRKIEAL